MRIIVDKVLIDCINKEYGLELTYASFKKFYIEVVKLQRDLSPSVGRRRKLNDDISDLISGEHEKRYERAAEREKLYQKYLLERDKLSELNKD